MKHPIVELTELIHKYKENKNSFSTTELVTLREDISLAMFYCADFYSDTRMESEAADFNRKQCLAEQEEALRGTKSNKTGKNMTREEIINTARLKCKVEEEKLLDRQRRWTKMKILYDSTTQILHALSSRISHINK